jgi:hypothetical protein
MSIIAMLWYSFCTSIAPDIKKEWQPAHICTQHEEGKATCKPVHEKADIQELLS